MGERRQFISDQYHFLSEMIFISIIMIVPIHFSYNWIPVWNTLIPAIPLCGLFIWLEIKGIEYKYYYWITPFLFCGYILLEFPILLSFLLSLIIIWRYLRIRQLLIVGRETRYTFMSTLFSLAVYALTNNIYAILLFSLLLFTLILGYIFSHIAVLDDKRRRMSSSIYTIGLTICLFCGGVVAFLITSQDFFSRAIDQIIYFFLTIVGRFTYLLQFVTQYDQGDFLEEQVELGHMEKLFSEGSSGITSILGMLLIGFLIFLAISCVVILFIVIRRDPATHEGIGRRGMLGKLTDGLQVYSKMVKKMITSRNENKHPVRKMVHDFERQAYKQKIGRKKSETINEWFKRIGIQVNVDIYQKVRYGSMDVTEQEIETLRMEIEKFHETIN
ncbi:hypothetical protein [Ornithinibacillus halotolerans]|uniref:DUF4129 domain-containing protein n=1 Tax=Ornithinibacillus halotolerans TaxID=1274357 RepID=A0A916RXT9_9BACI|nr:hypothetical protein [Ornithinibacillus halotolerans]GGA74489.1 hypothetical protein GCM10008025_17780 [Ornithinibacillus halotolerans]